MSDSFESDSIREERLAGAVLDFEKSCDSGGQPTLEEWLARYPDLRAEVSGFFEDRAFLVEILEPLRSSNPPSTIAGFEPPSQADLPGTKVIPACPEISIPGYEVLGRVAPGGMGIVYLARHLGMDRLVALKVIRPECLPNTAARKRFRTEARACAQLDHPNIVRIWDYSEAEDAAENGAIPFIAMEYVPGGTLAACKKQPPAGRAAAALVARVAEGVDYAHRRGIVHRDLKCANILLTEDGIPKIADFGLAKLLSPGEAKLTRGVGTPGYMSPEQACGGTVGPATDVFGLGAILYELLTCRPPYQGKNIREILEQSRQGAVVPPRRLEPAVPAALERICLRALAPDPQQRYPSAAALAKDLRRFANRPRRLALAAGIAAAVLLLAGLTALALRPRQEGVLPPQPAPGPEQPVAAVKVERLRVMHFRTEGMDSIPRGEIGRQSFQVHHGDAVTLEVTLSRPGYFYVVGFNFDGREQLLWPTDGKGMPSAEVEPPQLDRLRFPSGNTRLFLDDDAPGGLQAYVVAASSRPLPPFAQWRAGLGDPGWKSLPAGKGVWEADPRGTYPADPAGGPDRGSLRADPEAPPLHELCRRVVSEGVETVEAVAFPVLPAKKSP